MSPPSLARVLAEWGRIGVTGFGGPPAHISLLRSLCVERHGWLSDSEFEDAIAACNLLPGPASTQMAIFCGWRVRASAGAVVGGLAFILPGLIAVVALAALFLGSPPDWIRGAGAGAGAAVPAVAVQAGALLVGPSLSRARGSRRVRWWIYALLGGAAVALVGPWVVLVLLACGVGELLASRRSPIVSFGPWPLIASAAALPALAWTALKVGALSYGGGFVIIPLMQADAVDRHHWLTDAEFLNAVALGQVTPGPVTHTVAVVGYGAAGVAGAALAAAVAFAPSFLFVLGGAARFDALRANALVRAFLDGAGPAAIGAIVGSAVPLALALSEPWQGVVAVAALVVLVGLKRGVVPTLVAAGAVGAAVALAGGPVG